MASGPQPVERDSRGILDPWLLRQRVRLTRYPPGPALAGGLGAFVPGSAEAREVARIAQAAEIDRSVRRLQDLAERSGIPPRTLQRLFLRNAGVSPT